MFRQIHTIGYYTLLEALRNRLSWLFAVLMLAGIGLSGFLNELALTEKTEIQLALLAAMLRFGGIFLLATFVVTSMAREMNDRGLHLVLALPVTRACYLFGKMAGFAVLAVVPALLFGLLTALLAVPEQSLIWTLSLMLECWIIAAFSMLCVLSFNQIMPALSAVMGFYALARSVSALQLIGNQPLQEHTPSQRIISFMIDCLSAVLPHLDQFTRSDWLVYHNGDWLMLAGLSAQAAIYLAVLAGAALFDIYRKNF